MYTIIHNGLIYDAVHEAPFVGDLLIDGGRIAAIGKNLDAPAEAQVVDAVLDRPGHLTHVVVEDRDGRRALAAQQFIDATGDAILAARAGFKTWTQPRSDLQAHTLCAILAGADHHAWAIPFV